MKNIRVCPNKNIWTCFKIRDMGSRHEGVVTQKFQVMHVTHLLNNFRVSVVSKRKSFSRGSNSLPRCWYMGNNSHEENGFEGELCKSDIVNFRPHYVELHYFLLDFISLSVLVVWENIELHIISLDQSDGTLTGASGSFAMWFNDYFSVPL